MLQFNVANFLSNVVRTQTNFTKNVKLPPLTILQISIFKTVTKNARSTLQKTNNKKKHIHTKQNENAPQDILLQNTQSKHSKSGYIAI